MQLRDFVSNNNKSSEKSEDLFFKVKICIFVDMEKRDSFNCFEKDIIWLTK